MCFENKRKKKIGDIWMQNALLTLMSFLTAEKAKEKKGRKEERRTKNERNKEEILKVKETEDWKSPLTNLKLSCTGMVKIVLLSTYAIYVYHVGND
jgi:hypothetical protein